MELLGTRTEARNSSSSSSNKVSNAFHQEAVTGSQASDGLEGARTLAIETGCMDARGAQRPQSLDGMDAMEAWTGKGTPTMPCRYQTQGMGAAMPEVEPEGYKMTYCKFWESGRCSKGALCTFAR